MYAVAYNLIRGMILEASRRHEVPIERISFKSTVQQLSSWLWLFMDDSLSQTDRQQIMAKFYMEIATSTLPERPGRSEPRAKKRRPKNYNLLTKPRHEMVIDYHRNRPAKKNALYALS